MALAQNDPGIRAPWACRRRHSIILEDIESLAVRLLAKPYLAFGFRSTARDLATEIAEAIAKPLPGQYPIGDNAAMLATCLVNIARDPRAERWQAIARQLLPWVREDMREALNADLEEMLDTR